MNKFPTNKQHISFSEVKNWSECPFRHKLLYIDKIKTYEDNPYADFGSIIHDEIENFLNGSLIDINGVINKIEKTWKKKLYDSAEYIKKVTEQRKAIGSIYKHDNIEYWKTSAKTILIDLPQFLKSNFPDWTPHAAEEKLYEHIPNSEINFKGFIDCIIKVPKSKKSKKYNFWIIDWKTTGKTGWYWTKRKDFLFSAQVNLYKQYWAQKYNIPYADIKTAFVFLKRGAASGKSCELMKVPSGPKALEKSHKLVQNMIKNVKKQNYLKNYNNCKFCPFKQSEHCSGNGW